MVRFIVAITFLVASASGTLASGLTGEWLNSDGKSKVRFADCGDAVCGTISWLKDPSGDAAKIGQQVFFGMKPAGENVWKGSAFNPEDGKTYSGKLTLSGNHLRTAGCVLGGLICKSVDWTRSH